jgi:hypothetical protein
MDDSTRESLTLPADARLLAVEVLLADPGALGNDALESDLYILRDTPRARARQGSGVSGGEAPTSVRYEKRSGR